MANRAVQFKVPAQQQKPPPFRLEHVNGGVNYKSEILDNQSPYCSNVWLDGAGDLEKRPGQAWLYTNTLGAGAILGVFDYTKADGTTTQIIAHGTKLYTQSGDDDPVEILSGLTASKGVAFVFSDIFYYKNGAEFIQYDGTTAAAVVGYIPTIVTDKAPDGTGGASNEELNIFSDSWGESFTADGTSTEYVLFMAASSIHAVKINGVLADPSTYTHTEDTDKVTFGSAPADGAEVLIQPTKTGLNDATQVTKCRRVAIFGGANDTRVFLTGNPDYQATVYWCGLTDPTYWPVGNYGLIGSDAQANANMAVLYDQLILLKERSIYRIEFNLSSTGEVSFPSYPIHSTIGCDMPESVQIVDNALVFSNTYAGVHILTRTDIRSERNVLPLSGNINYGTIDSIDVGLLQQTKANLVAATSTDDGKRYILCVGTNAWVWDYRNSPYQGNDIALAWFPWTDINANFWLIKDGVTYYGDKTTGNIAYLIPGTFNDFGDSNAITAFWRSKVLDFNLPEWEKYIEQVHFRSRESSNTKLTITHYTNEEGAISPSTDVISASFNWDKFSWDVFSWDVFIFPPVFRLKPKIKKAVYYQMEVRNETANQNLSIMDLVIRYSLTRLKK